MKNLIKSYVYTLAKTLMQKYLGVPFLFVGLNFIRKQKSSLTLSTNISIKKEVKLKMSFIRLLMVKVMKLQLLVPSSL